MKVYQLTLLVAFPERGDVAGLSERLGRFARELSTDSAPASFSSMMEAKAILTNVFDAAGDPADATGWHGRAREAIGKRNPEDCFEDLTTPTKDT
jgi:hypothetical protein